ncbi:MAG: fumarate hydratase, partial [Deltaproteobacteria bacterium]|nr:fumarate hydratase [Deltaproteobacteria bacterium]
MTEFQYQEMFPLGEDETEYRLVSKDHVTTASFEDREVIMVAPRALTLLAEEAFRDVSHLLRPAHLKKVAAIFDDPEASAN